MKIQGCIMNQMSEIIFLESVFIWALDCGKKPEVPRNKFW